MEILKPEFNQILSNLEIDKELKQSEVEKKAIAFFREVQAYPFSTSKVVLGLNVQEEYEYTKCVKIGSCTTKHNLLAIEFTKLGLKTILVTHPFYWQDLPVKYPTEIQELVSEMPMQYHLALGVYKDRNQSIIDATWDPPLRNAGFQVGSLDNKIQSTPLGVVPAGSAIFHYTIEQRQKYIEEIKSQMPNDPLVGYFYDSLDSWLQRIRNNQEED